MTPYRTLEHIVGVHHVAVTAGRALRRGGVELDLALVSGSAIGHDIGKFGCRLGERVPYLHYYYTDQWFRRRKLTDIGHVAANHSVWDLELDYLSVESLLLIYADFRVKQTRDDHGREVTKIFSLAEAFNVILSKLDGVDREKRRRYELVYARLYDFEQFMLARGVDVTLLGRDTPPRPEKHTALMTDQEALGRPDPAVRGPQHRPDAPADGTAELCLPAGAGPGRNQLAASAGLSGGVRVLLPVSAHSPEGPDPGLSV